MLMEKEIKTIDDILEYFREKYSNQQYMGRQFELLMLRWLKTDARYKDYFEKIWLWENFPYKDDLGSVDLGIDIVAKTYEWEYWAIQCKFYKENSFIDKEVVASFLANSGRKFKDKETGQEKGFTNRLWIATTNKWTKPAEETIKNQEIPVNRIDLDGLRKSSVDWGKIFYGNEGKDASKANRALYEYQVKALEKACEHYRENDRGQLIMACGTGKTFTSLRLVEQELSGKGVVLFLVPSIGLLGQSLNDWFADAQYPLKAICVCSDENASRKQKGNGDEDNWDSFEDLPHPASTNKDEIVRQLESYKNHQGILVVFSTYQSIDKVAEAQKIILGKTNDEFGVFDFIVCDEAHRTTGIEKNDSDFTKIHDNNYIKGKKRLYMTATPRLYKENAEQGGEKAICSMDDEKKYGKEFHRVGFGYAVENGILTDYKVLVLTVEERMIPENLMQEIRKTDSKELNYDDTGRLIGVINALSKRILGDQGVAWDTDPCKMRRVLAFAHSIGSENKSGSSKNIAKIFPKVSKIYYDSLSDEERKQVVQVETRHLDGTMGVMDRNRDLDWLKKEPENPDECRVITNVRCLSEGIDVPALDAVIFLAPRKSQVDIVQSVGRVMRSFNKGKENEKKYGYIIIPMVIPEGISPEEALNDNKTYSEVWGILNAMRSHDDRFNAYINNIALNKNKVSEGAKIIVGVPGLGQNGIGKHMVSGDTEIFENWEQPVVEIIQKNVYAKLVEKCGDRNYWENWAKQVGAIAQKYIARISRLVEKEGPHLAEFKKFHETLKHNLNSSITSKQCIEMLAQHFITRPIFEVLFSEHQFVKSNYISVSMQKMVDMLEKEAVDKDLDELQKFYDSVRISVGKIDNLQGKQNVIKDLYEKFFQNVFSKDAKRLGIVYTPDSCVDFIIHSVDEVLKKEFNSVLTNENVHILDPFTGTGTFITQLLKSGLIKQEDMLRKYQREIHANEIILLAYYVASVNIESVFQEICPQANYTPFTGLCFMDTFQLRKKPKKLLSEFFRENSEAIEKQQNTPIQVIIGNPPYSVGQKNANDNAQNQKYPDLEERIAATYVKNSKTKNKNRIYDSYIKAYRWATDRLDTKHGSVIAFITNGSFIDGISFDGFRASLQTEFDKIYVVDLRGSIRGKSTEEIKREGQNVFNIQTGVAIAILIRYPEKSGVKRKGEIYYHNIGDYLDREQKFQALRNAKSYYNLKWETITPNKKHDWLNQRDGLFDTLVPLATAEKNTNFNYGVFSDYSTGITTSRDTWVYGFAKEQVSQNMRAMIDFYNKQVAEYKQSRKAFSREKTRIKWTDNLEEKAKKGETYSFEQATFVESAYRPFCKQHLYYHRPFIERPRKFAELFPAGKKNLAICVSLKDEDFSTLITDAVTDLHLFGDGTQCFPLYIYI